MSNKKQILKKIEIIKEEFNQKIQELSELENQLHNEEKKKTGWEKVGYNNRYYTPCIGGTRSHINENDEFDEKAYEEANYFSTKEKSKEVAFKQELFRKLQRFADENNEGEIDWNDENQEKYKICYNKTSNDLYISYDFASRNFGVVYFVSFEVAEKAIETFKEDLKKYFGMG